jgi:aryl-alcohol dehydrogenase-like predicted oxidoreductase
VNFIDTADAYGPQEVERLIGEALSPYAPGVVVATKGGLARMGPSKSEPLGRPAYLRQEVEMSLRYLKLQRIDLWQLHRIDPLIAVEESLGEIARLQDEGKIRHVGLSEVGIEEIERARKVVPIVSVQNKYNLGERKHEAVLNFCEKESIGFIPWYPVAAGKLTAEGGKLGVIAKRYGFSVSQIMLAWSLRRSPVMLPIPGTSSVAHLEENVASAAIELADADWDAIEAAAQ